MDRADQIHGDYVRRNEFVRRVAVILLRACRVQSVIPGVIFYFAACSGMHGGAP